MALSSSCACTAGRHGTGQLMRRAKLRQGPLVSTTAAFARVLSAPRSKGFKSVRARGVEHIGIARRVAIPSEMGVPNLASESFGIAASAPNRSDLWDLLEYNSNYFNPHKMVSILQQVLEEPPAELRTDRRLSAYLRQASSSVQLYENLKDLTAKDVAMAVTTARDLGLVAAEELSDVLVTTVSKQLAKLPMRRVSFFITAFAKQGISDTRFWRAAAAAVSSSTEPLNPQVVVSLFDAFRKSGLRSERVFQALAHRVYGVIEDLTPAHIPPIVATICRVPLAREERERLLRALLSRWLSALRQQREQDIGAITPQQILSLTVSIGLVPDEINTAVFARDVSAYINERFDVLETEDLIVFLSAMQRLVLSGSLTSFFNKGLMKISDSWSDLQMTSQLSAQRLTQLSDVLVAVRQEAPDSTKPLAKLQDLVIKDLSEAVQHCSPDGLAELMEIWTGHEAFWRHYRDFGEAITKRMEEFLLESEELDDILPVLQAALAVPGLMSSLPGRARQVLANAVQSRAVSDVERIRAVLNGSPWETLCGSAAETLASDDAPTSSVASASSLGRTGVGVQNLMMTRGRPGTANELLDFLNDAQAQMRGPEDALWALQTTAPFAQRLAAEASGEVFELLGQICNQLAQNINALDPPRIVAALHACGVAGLPHVPLFVAAITSLDTSNTAALPLVEVFESAAAVRLAIPELRPWLDHLLAQGLDRRLPANGLARLLTATARLALLDLEKRDGETANAHVLLQRLVTVASSMRPLSVDTLATLCHGLYLARWDPDGPELFQLVSWLAQADDSPKTPPQAIALRHFALSLLARAEGRTAAELFGLELRCALASAIVQHSPLQQTVPSDTALKFRHEVSEVLRQVHQPYDLDIKFCPGFSVDLAILGGYKRPDGVLWLLDGPEAFQRPFVDSVQTAGLSTTPLLRLVPAELRRAELLATLRSKEQAEEMVDALCSWGAFGGCGDKTAASLGLRQGEVPTGPLARLHWLEWAAMTPHARLAALADPGARLAVVP